MTRNPLTSTDNSIVFCYILGVDEERANDHEVSEDIEHIIFMNGSSRDVYQNNH